MEERATNRERAETGSALHHVDLILGAWRPREAARQLAAATGVTLTPGFDDGAAAPDEDTLSAIDFAASGDPAVQLAHDDAARIAAALAPSATVVLLPPRYHRAIGMLDDWFFFHLRRRLVPLIVGSGDLGSLVSRAAFEQRRGFDGPPPGAAIDSLSPEQRRLLRFFPGLLPRDLAARFGPDPVAAGLVAVGPGHFLIPPAYRDSDPAGAAADLDTMEALEALDPGFMALAQTHCTAHFADSALLCDLARRSRRAGEAELAHTLAARARAVARTPEAMALADLVRLETRLDQRRFADLVAASPPSRQATEETRRAIAGLRLRAAVERGEGAEEPGLRETVDRLEAGTASTGDLHLILLHLRAAAAAGKNGGAGALAERLDAALADPGADQRLVFLSALSRAALAARSGDRPASRAALGLAFATSAGARGLGEVVAMNALMARAEDETAARFAWLRAALAWLACEPPEALPEIAVEAILGGAAPTRERLEAVVGEALLAALDQAWTLPASGAKESAIEIRAVERAAFAPDLLIGGTGAAVLWSGEPGKGFLAYPLRDRLTAAVAAIFGEICPGSEELRAGTMLVDCNAGLDIPATRAEALSVALRAGVTRAIWEEETIPLDPFNRPRAAADLRAALSPAVAATEGPDSAIAVRFRRYLPETTVTGLEAELLAPIRQRGRIPLGTVAVLCGRPLAETERLLRGLEDRRIVRLDVTERQAA